MSGKGGAATTKVAVIGAGIVGITCASYLQRDGHDVTVIDRVAPGEGCSKGNAGCLSPGSVIPLAGPGVLRHVPGWLRDPLGPLAIRWAYLPRALPWLLRFARAGTPQEVERASAALRALHRDTFENYAPLVRAAGAEVLIRRTGQLHVYSTEEGFWGDAAGWPRRRALGVAVEELDRSQIRQIEPALAPIFARAVYLPEHGHTWTRGASCNASPSASSVTAASCSARTCAILRSGRTARRGCAPTRAPLKLARW